MKLRDKRCGGRIVERLSESINKPVCDDKRANTRYKAGRENSQAEYRNAYHHHPLAAKEVGGKTSKGNRQSVDKSKDCADEPELDVRRAD